MAYPLRATVPEANEDLSPEVRSDYVEAASILPYSPRASAALLRLAIQKLCTSLTEEKDLNDAIGLLVKRGLSTVIQQSLDLVRVIGNHAVHPGTIDLRDDQGTAGSLFDLVNRIAEAMISEPRRIAELYAKLPESARAAIEKRDAEATTS